MKKLLSHGTILVGHSLNNDLQGRYILELALLGIFPLVWNTFFTLRKLSAHMMCICLVKFIHVVIYF